jgi:gamma-glutamylputrescine oxidase
LRARVGDGNMRYEELGGFEIFRKEEGSVYAACMERMPEFNGILKGITGVADTFGDCVERFGLGKVGHIIANRAEGQIDTGRMMLSLLKLARGLGIEVFNGIEVESIDDNGLGVQLTTRAGWSFETKKLLVATNGFARGLMPDLEVTPARNQVLITKPIAGLGVRGSFHYDRGYYYFRNVGSRVLIGGGRKLDILGETTTAFGHTDLIENSLLDLLREVVLPDVPFEIADKWSGIMGIGVVKKPIIKHVSPNVVVAVRMGGMGVAIGSLVGEEAACLIED